MELKAAGLIMVAEKTENVMNLAFLQIIYARKLRGREKAGSITKLITHLLHRRVI